MNIQVIAQLKTLLESKDIDDETKDELRDVLVDLVDKLSEEVEP